MSAENNAPIILVVEDDDNDFFIIEKKLNKLLASKKIVHAISLFDVFDQGSHVDADLILLDLNLPDGHGVPTIKQLQSFILSKPIIVITGSGNKALNDKAKELDIVGFLSKNNINDGELSGLLKKALNDKFVPQT